jgi:hypothetical protein
MWETQKSKGRNKVMLAYRTLLIPRRPVTWTAPQIQALKKRVFGNYLDNNILKKMEELNARLRDHERKLFSQFDKAGWLEVERIANEIAGLINFRTGH